MLQRVLVVAALSLASDVFASDVPKAVTEAVKRKYPDARIVSAKQEPERKEGKAVYSVSLARGKQEMDVDVDSDGKIVSEEESVEFSAVPEQVQKALKDSKYGNWKVKHVERVTLDEKDSTAHFEILVQSGKQQEELVFALDGRLEKEESPKKNHRGAAKREVEQMEEKEHPPK
jgi:hypothetical protein